MIYVFACFSGSCHAVPKFVAKMSHQTLHQLLLLIFWLYCDSSRKFQIDWFPFILCGLFYMAPLKITLAWAHQIILVCTHFYECWPKNFVKKKIPFRSSDQNFSPIKLIEQHREGKRAIWERSARTPIILRPLPIFFFLHFKHAKI